MASDTYTAIMSIPGADQALQFLQQEATAFAYLPSRIEGIRQSLQGLYDRAVANNDQTTAAQAAAALSGLPSLQGTYADASGQVAGVLSAVQGGAPVDVLSLVPRVLSAAAQATLAFKSVDLFESAANKLAASAGLTPAEIATLKSGGYGARGFLSQPVVKWGLIIGGVWLAWRFLRRR